MNCKGRSKEIGRTKFQAKRPRRNTHSHGYMYYNTKRLALEVSHAFGPWDLRILCVLPVFRLVALIWFV